MVAATDRATRNEKRIDETRREMGAERRQSFVQETRERESFNAGIYFRPISGIPRRWNLLSATRRCITRRRTTRRAKETIARTVKEMGAGSAAERRRSRGCDGTRHVASLRQRSDVPSSQRGSSRFSLFSFFFFSPFSLERSTFVSTIVPSSCLRNVLRFFVCQSFDLM